MVNLKGIILEVLEKALEEADIVAEVTDSFPEDFRKDTQIQYTEEQNKPQDLSGTKCINSYVRYRIDIWNTRSTSELAVLVDKALNGEIGLVRSDCMDDNGNSKKHKIMRYEGIVNEKDGRVFSPR